MKILKHFYVAVALVSVSVLLNGCGATGSGILDGLKSVGSAVVNDAVTNGSTSLLGQAVAGSSNKYVQQGASVLNSVLKTMKTGVSGTAQSYANGALTAQLLSYNTTSKGYVNTGSQVSTTATSTLTVSSSAVALTIPAITAGGATMSQTTITNLVATSGVYGLGDNSSCTEGKLTINGNSYDLANAYVKLTYSGTTSCSYEASIYFDYDSTTQQYMYAMNITFKK